MKKIVTLLVALMLLSSIAKAGYDNAGFKAG